MSFNGRRSHYTDFNRSYVDPNAVLDDKPLSLRTQHHLSRVYFTLTVCLSMTAAGAYLQPTYFYYLNTMFTFLVTIASMLCVVFLPQHKPSTQLIRYGMLLVFAFSWGLVFGPYIDEVMMEYPKVIPTALATTAALFLSFTVSSLMTQRRNLLYIVGLIGALSSVWAVTSLINILFMTNITYRFELYLGLVTVSLYVMYDTQMIIARAERGLYDVPTDCIELLFDAFKLFLHIVAILADREREEREKRERKHRRRNSGQESWGSESTSHSFRFRPENEQYRR